MFSNKKRIWVLITCCASTVVAWAQPTQRDAEIGSPFIQHYTPNDYQAHVQNWASIQDHRGVMYFGNVGGILEYDGVSWQLINTMRSTHVRSLDIDKHGRIFVGAFGEIGYIDFDSLGRSYFSPLGQYLDTAFHDFLDVWKTFCMDDGVYFSSYKYLFRWSPAKDHASEGKFKVWKTSSQFQFSFAIGEKLFIQEKGIGLMELVNDTLQLIPGGDTFKDSWVFAMMRQPGGKILIVDRTHGLFHYDGRELIKIKAPADQQIVDSRIFHGIALPDGNFALATNLKGILVISKDGDLLRTIDVASGLQNQSATSLFLDRQGAVWVTLSNGIDRVEINSPFSLFDNVLDESNSIHSIVRHQGKIHFASGVGVYVVKDQQVLRKIAGIATQCWDLASLGNTLLVATSNGLFSIDGAKAALIGDGVTRSLYRSRRDSTQVLVGKERSVALYSARTRTLTKSKFQAEVNDWIFFIEQDINGDVWCSTPYNGIYRLKTDSSNNVLSWDHLGIEQGLPTLNDNTARLVSGRLLASTQNGIYAFDAATRRFKVDSFVGTGFMNMITVHLVDDRQGGVWIHGRRDGKRIIGHGSLNSGQYAFNTTPFNRFSHHRIYTIYPDVEGITWFGGPNGVIRYDPNTKKDFVYSYKALIRKVFIGNDSLIYGGGPLNNFTPVLAYNHNALRFEFAAPSYDDASAIRYSYFLDGFDKGWSDWTTETKKDYTNLPDGNYQLMVKAIDVYDNISGADAFYFSILSPWYKRWWAYAFYVFVAGVSLTGLVQWRVRRIRKEKETLEGIVAERTREVALQSHQLIVQAEKLKALDQTKSRFFANISHEFRTPLTLIAGCLEDLSQHTEDPDDRMRLVTMKKNTHRLRQLIDQLLDLSKLESGKLNLCVEPINPGNFLNAITSSFASWAGQKNIALSIALPDHSFGVYFDPDVLEKIIDNLLSNAIKFTPSNGEVSFSAEWSTEELRIQVKDNGPGIPAAKLPHIFERFYQADDSNSRVQEGSGIGLALVKELVSLHHGTIAVESDAGKGTTFNLSIPINEKSYKPAEIGTKGSVINLREKDSWATEAYPEWAVTQSDTSIVLVVEDNVDLGLFIGNHLPGYEIMLSRNGKEGLEKAVEHIPDLIISDVMMPEMDGVEFCRRVKGEEKTSHIPVILLTAKADIESRLEGLETGADDYMTKPFDARELQTRVRNLILQRETLRARFSRTVVLKPGDIAITSPDEAFLKKVMTIVEAHLSDAEFSVEDFQREIGMSRMQLHRKLKALTGHSVGEFVRIQRLVRAGEMLSKTGHNVTAVCYQTGFTSVSYFAKCFKKHFGVNPKDYASGSARV